MRNKKMLIKNTGVFLKAQIKWIDYRISQFKDMKV